MKAKQLICIIEDGSKHYGRRLTIGKKYNAIDYAVFGDIVHWYIKNDIGRYDYYCINNFIELSEHRKKILRILLK
jgi:hypothetical protein